MVRKLQHTIQLMCDVRHLYTRFIVLTSRLTTLNDQQYFIMNENDASQIQEQMLLKAR